MNNIKSNLKHHDDEVNILKILNSLWNSKWIVFSITTLFSIIAVIFSLSLPNIYQTKVVLSPLESPSGVSQSMNGLGGLASLAGVNISSSSIGNIEKSLAKIKTISFFEEQILPNIFLPNLMAVKSWNSETNTIIYDDDLYNAQNQSLIENPSNQKSYKEFMDILDVTQTTDGFVTISVKHQSPFIAKAWTELLVNQLNNFFREKDKTEAKAALNFLNSQIALTSYSEIKQAAALLYQEKMKQLMLIEANEFYVFSYIEPPLVMEEKIQPVRSSISILGTVLGLLLGFLIVLIRDYLKKS